MPILAAGEAAIRQELDRVLQSPGFARNERMSRFLQFVVQRTVEGRSAELKETVIATEVFGRPPDYNPKQDAIVRTEAGRLRARLGEYYSTEGASDAVVIELPRGDPRGNRSGRRQRRVAHFDKYPHFAPPHNSRRERRVLPVGAASRLTAEFSRLVALSSLRASFGLIG
jgi:hypothetical protein